MEQATRRPHRPSDYIGMRAAGATEAACFDFDMAIESYAITIRLREQEMHEVPKPTRQSTTISVPLYPTLSDQIGLKVGDEQDQSDEALDAAKRAIVDRISGTANSADIPDIIGLLTNEGRD